MGATKYILLFIISQQLTSIQAIEFNSLGNCQKAGEMLMDDFDDKDDNGVVTDHHSVYHCVLK